ncbi:MAG TPA: hypothetical protein VGJ98_03580 [Candidatus Eisenbacteria bacterium]|jgi:hypothetical protein
MRFDPGIHPRQWHRGAWLLAFLSGALVLLLTHRPTGGRAFAMEPSPVPPPVQESPPPSEAVTVPPVESIPPAESAPTGEGASPVEGLTPASEAPPVPAAPRSGSGYVAEIVDSSYTVGPAEFFALDLPMIQPGAKAVHLLGTVTTKGKKDIVVRLFRASDYDRWLKQKSGRKPQAFWTSPRSGSLTLDQDLPAGVPVVLLLDNGYSIRTPKKVICQLQLRYQRDGTETFDTEGGKVAGSGTGTKTERIDDNLPAPRSNSDLELPPPPPPPPTGY